jgi:hypothetical protein
MGYAGHVVHSSASGLRNIDALFFFLGCNGYGFDKKRLRTRYAKLVLLHLVGSAGHVVHCSESRDETSTHYFSCSGGTGTDLTRSASGHVMSNLCFCIRWDLRVT